MGIIYYCDQEIESIRSWNPAVGLCFLGTDFGGVLCVQAVVETVTQECCYCRTTSDYFCTIQVAC